MLIAKVLLLVLTLSGATARGFLSHVSSDGIFSSGRDCAPVSLGDAIPSVPKKFLDIEASLPNEFDTGSFYWYGKDLDGSPTLWYRIDRMAWNDIVFEKRMQYTDVVMKSVLQRMPSEFTDLNFVLLLDDFSPMQILKHPTIGPAFFKSFIKACPNDCLKQAIMVTGTTGHVFYKIVKGLASKSFTKKIAVVRSREAAASLLVERGILGSIEKVPSFLGGNFIHQDRVTKSLSSMISSLY